MATRNFQIGENYGGGTITVDDDTHEITHLKFNMGENNGSNWINYDRANPPQKECHGSMYDKTVYTYCVHDDCEGESKNFEMTFVWDTIRDQSCMAGYVFGIEGGGGPGAVYGF